MTPFDFDKDDPLKRCLGESKRANSALRDYAAMGAGRSLRALFEGYDQHSTSGTLADKPPTAFLNTVFTWSLKFSWQDRVAIWDDMQDRAEEEYWKKRQREIRRDDDAMGKRLREVVQEFLVDLPKFIQTRRVKQGEKMTMDPVTGEQIKEVTYVQFVKINTNPGQLGQAGKAASELQRVAAGFIDKLALTDPTGEKSYKPIDTLSLESLSVEDMEILLSIMTKAKGNGVAPNGKEQQS